MQTTETGTVSRQRIHQMKKKDQGRCMICSNSLSPHSRNYCEHHRKQVSQRQRKNRVLTQALLSDDFPEKLWSNALDNFIR